MVSNTFFVLVCLRLVNTMLPVSLDCPLLIAHSVFSNVYVLLQAINIFVFNDSIILRISHESLWNNKTLHLYDNRDRTGYPCIVYHCFANTAFFLYRSHQFQLIFICILLYITKFMKLKRLLIWNFSMLFLINPLLQIQNSIFIVNHNYIVCFLKPFV